LGRARRRGGRGPAARWLLVAGTDRAAVGDLRIWGHRHTRDAGHDRDAVDRKRAGNRRLVGDSPGRTGFKFDPATLTVPVGSTVTWTNKDEEPHTIAAKDGSFHSPTLDTKGTYSFTFTKPGSYDYICSIHPFMTGTVVVTA